MKKLGCAKCGGTKKMKLGGSAVAKAPVNMYGIPQENMGTSSQMGFGRKGGSVKKEHVLTTFRKANDARNERVMKSLPKAEVGMSTSNRIIDSNHRKVVKPIKSDAGASTSAKPRIRSDVSARSISSPIKSANPTREPRIKFGDPMVGIPASTPKPKGRYEDAVINTKSPSTRTAAIPRSSAKAPVQHTSGYTPKRGETTTVKKTVGPRPSVDEMREANIKKYSALKSKIAEDKRPKPGSTASAIKAGMAGSAGYAIANMFKKNGGAVKSKKK